VTFVPTPLTIPRGIVAALSAPVAAPHTSSHPSARRVAVAGVLGLLVPGAGHALLGRGRAAAIFLVPVILLTAGALGLYTGGGFTAILAFAVTPGVLPVLAILNIALAVWRIAAALDVSRASSNRGLAAAVLAPSILALVLVPQLWVNTTIAATEDFFNATFASGPDATEEPAPPEDSETPQPDWTFPPDETPEPIITPDPRLTPDPLATPTPSPTPRPPGTAGIGNLPGLNIAVPWKRPGEVPWGNDGRFDLLLLGSDAGPNRWSRRMDVMLLVEIDVKTGKTAMIGLPRNLTNAPFPPGSARDAVACGCLRGLLNEAYVEATIRHPDRWPGTGAAEGIGAVRAMVSELTGRPVDAVLVADLWGVIKVVDAMGGIDINVPTRLYDPAYPDPILHRMVLDIPAGKQHFDGRTALAYARSRHSTSDYSRMARQQTLLLAIREDIGPKTILRAPDLFNAAKGFVWTDLPRSSLPNLVSLFGKASDATVKHLRIVPPTYPSWLTPMGIHKIQVAIAKLLGTPIPPAPTTPPSPSATPTAGPTTGPTSTPSPTDAPDPTPTPTPEPTDTPEP
jgi:LCP family protein required for cell wall assembly